MELKSLRGIRHLNQMNKQLWKLVCIRLKIQNIYSFLSTRENTLFLDKWIVSCQELLLENDQWIPSQGLEIETRVHHPGHASVFELPAPLTWNKGNNNSVGMGTSAGELLQQSAQSSSEKQTEPPQDTVTRFMAHQTQSWPPMALFTTARYESMPCDTVCLLTDTPWLGVRGWS